MRRRLVSSVGAIVGAFAVGVAGAAVVPVGAAPPEEVHRGAPFVAESEAMRAYSHVPGGVAVDRWAVFVCRIDPATDAGSPERLGVTPAEAVEVLEEHITPYFAWLSEGAYRLELTAGVTISPGPVDDVGEAEQHCVDEAIAASGGLHGALVVHDATEPSGFASSGHEHCGETPCSASQLPESRRHVWLGGSTLFASTTVGEPHLATVAHEVGHALDWGHAGWHPNYWAVNQDWYRDAVDRWVWIWEQTPAPLREAIAAALPDDFPSVAELAADLTSGARDWDEVALLLTVYFGSLEYADLTDVMGVTPLVDGRRSSIAQTQAFNRWSAGWIADGDVIVHDGGSAIHRLAPIGLDGSQLLVLPTADGRAFFTLEVRRPSAFHPDLGHPGVLVHRVDQRPSACDEDPADCWGEDRITATEGADPYGFGHVLAPGTVREVGGVRIEVLAEEADGTATVRLGPPVAHSEGPPASAAQPRPTPPPAVPVVARPTFTG